MGSKTVAIVRCFGNVFGHFCMRTVHARGSVGESVGELPAPPGRQRRGAKGVRAGPRPGTGTGRASAWGAGAWVLSQLGRHGAWTPRVCLCACVRVCVCTCTRTFIPIKFNNNKAHCEATSLLQCLNFEVMGFQGTNINIHTPKHVTSIIQSTQMRQVYKNRTPRGDYEQFLPTVNSSSIRDTP